jgi:hypothetical protein
MRRWKDLISYSTAPVPPVTNPTIGMTATSATTSTAQKKFGTASMIISSNSGYIQNTSGDYAWWPSGTGPWTIQWWQYIPTSVSGATSREFCSNEETSGGLALRYGTSFNTGGLNAINIFARGQADFNYWNYTWTRDVWQFVSVCRNGTSVFLHVDGVSQAAGGGSGAGTRNFVATSGLNKIMIGNAGGTGSAGIYYDDFQVFGSTALYNAANYTAPTTEAILTTGTTALFNMNGTNGGTSFPNKTSN